MHDRSGNAILDALIDGFAAQERYRHWTLDGTEAGDAPLAPLRDPEHALGRCFAPSYDFAQRCLDAGLTASAHWSFFRALGAAYAEGHGTCQEHCVTAVETADRARYTVDWSSAQYGLTGCFPLVQRWDHGFQADWDDAAVPMLVWAWPAVAAA